MTDTPAWRACFAPQDKGSAEPKPTRIRIRIGNVHRDIPATDARAVADRLHDLCDRIEEWQRDA